MSCEISIDEKENLVEWPCGLVDVLTELMDLGIFSLCSSGKWPVPVS